MWSGTAGIGDKGAEYLQLLPSSIRDLDLSDSNLTAAGIKNVALFLKDNQNITGLIMWGNESDKVDGNDWFTMISENDMLEELDITPGDDKELPFIECSHIAWSLGVNSKIRRFTMSYHFSCIPRKTSEERVQAMVQSCHFAFNLARKKTLESIEFGIPQNDFFLEKMGGNVARQSYVEIHWLCQILLFRKGSILFSPQPSWCTTALPEQRI